MRTRAIMLIGLTLAVAVPAAAAAPTAPALNRTGPTIRHGLLVVTGLSIRCPHGGNHCSAKLSARWLQTKTIRMSPGQRRVIQLKLTPPGLRVLRHHGKLRTIVLCRGHNGARLGYSSDAITFR